MKAYTATAFCTVNYLSAVSFTSHNFINDFQSVVYFFFSLFESTHKGVNLRSKYVTQGQQQRPESPTVTLTWHACKYKVHTFQQRYIFILYLKEEMCVCGWWWWEWGRGGTGGRAHALPASRMRLCHPNFKFSIPRKKLTKPSPVFPAPVTTKSQDDHADRQTDRLTWLTIERAAQSMTDRRTEHTDTEQCNSPCQWLTPNYDSQVSRAEPPEADDTSQVSLGRSASRS